MTEKRFVLNSTGGVYGIEDNKENIGCFVANESSGIYLVDLLNSLNDENEQLKQEIKSLRNDLCFREMELEELEDIAKNVIE